MLFTLILAASIGQNAVKEWHPISNHPGWEGLGTVRADGSVKPERWRRVENRERELMPDGTVYKKPVEASRDAFGFVGWLNGVRAVRGLSGVAWSNEMAYWAWVNSSYGFGHFAMGTARRQNAGVGPLWTICNAWLAHGPHAAALLDPTLTEVGIAAVGSVWTFSGR